MTENTKSKVGASEIAGILRRDISSGALQFRDRFPSERSLAEKFNVARGTIRQALISLEEDNYVEIKRGSGTYVTFGAALPSQTSSEQANPIELVDARFALEPHICRLVVLHGRRTDFDRLDELCRRMESSQTSPQVFSDLDTEFHRLLAHCTGNSLLIWFIDKITSMRELEEWHRMRQLTLNEKIIREYNRQHRQILSSIREREPEKAATNMKEHLETARLSLTRAIET